MKKKLCLSLGALALAFTFSACGVQLGYPDGPTNGTSNGQKGEGRFMFISSTAVRGDIGVGAMDSECNRDRPNSGTYQAFIGTINRASNTYLQRNAQYVRADGTIIGKTNDLRVMQFTNSVGTTSEQVWTGLSADLSVTSNCSNWQSSAGTDVATVGQANTKGTGLYGSGASIACNQTRKLLCVEM